MLRASTTRRTSTRPTRKNATTGSSTGSVTNYWNCGGRHETKSGYEWFRSQRTGGNSQSSTSYVFDADYADRRRRRTPVHDRTAGSIPVFVPGHFDRSTTFPAIRGGVDQHRQQLGCTCRITGRSTTAVGRPRRPLRAREGGVDRANPSVDSNRIVPRARRRLRHQGQRQSGRPRHLRPVLRPVQRGADRRQQPGGKSGGYHGHIRARPGQGVQLRAGIELANYPINAANATVQDPPQNVVRRGRLRSPLVHEFRRRTGTNVRHGAATPRSATSSASRTT